MNFHPSTTKTSITAIFRNTIKPLNMELPAVPRISMMLIIITMSIAGMFIIPPSHGQAVR